MNLLRSIHETAMEYSTLGAISKAKGQDEIAREAYQFAFELEREAALKFPKEVDELTKYIWLRSAAALAYKAGLFQESENFIEICRAENPSKWIEKELEAVSELILASKKEAPNEGETKVVSGIFKDVNSQKNQIIIEDINQNQSFTLIVPRAVLVKIIRKHLAQSVNVEARTTPHGIMVLQKISAAA